MTEDERCNGCRCVTCRWRGAGSLYYYNNAGEYSSRCSKCVAKNFRGRALEIWKTDSFTCKGYEKKRVNGHG